MAFLITDCDTIIPHIQSGRSLYVRGSGRRICGVSHAAFQIAQDNRVRRISAGHFDKERYLQQLVEANLFEIFGVQFIASEFVIRGEQPGRIDTLGLDTDGAPTIIEYKRSESEAVINQGLYYMNWLLEHRGDFVVAARDALGHDVEVNWTGPRLIILAQGYASGIPTPSD